MSNLCKPSVGIKEKRERRLGKYVVVDREMPHALPAHMPCCEELVKSFHLSLPPSESASAVENHLAQDDT